MCQISLSQGKRPPRLSCSGGLKNGQVIVVLEIRGEIQDLALQFCDVFISPEKRSLQSFLDRLLVHHDCAQKEWVRNIFGVCSRSTNVRQPARRSVSQQHRQLGGSKRLHTTPAERKQLHCLHLFRPQQQFLFPQLLFLFPQLSFLLWTCRACDLAFYGADQGHDIANILLNIIDLPLQSCAGAREGSAIALAVSIRSRTEERVRGRERAGPKGSGKQRISRLKKMRVEQGSKRASSNVPIASRLLGSRAQQGTRELRKSRTRQRTQEDCWHDVVCGDKWMQ